MAEPNRSHTNRVCLERVQALPINAASRSEARREFERAEAWVTRLLAIVDRLLEWMLTARHTSVTRRQRVG